MITAILNEDGTICNPPKNPLKEKWDKLYPPTPMPQFSEVCDGYSCIGCSRCPSGSNWEIPEEDRAVWQEYQQQIREYDRVHNPSLYALYNK